MKGRCEATSFLSLSLRPLGGLCTWGCESKCGGGFEPGLTSFPCSSSCLSWYWSKPSWFLVLFLHSTSKVINTMSLCSLFFRRVRSTCHFLKWRRNLPYDPHYPGGGIWQCMIWQVSGRAQIKISLLAQFNSKSISSFVISDTRAKSAENLC